MLVNACFMAWVHSCWHSDSEEAKKQNETDVRTKSFLILSSSIVTASLQSLSSRLPLSDNKDVSVMMSEMDVNAIAGTLKLYFRELPEPLFTDELYPNFAGGISKTDSDWFNYHFRELIKMVVYQDFWYIMRVWDCAIKKSIYPAHKIVTWEIMWSSFAALTDSVAKESCMLNLLLSLPEPNLVTFLFLLDHLKR